MRLLVVLLFAMNLGAAAWWVLRPLPSAPTPATSEPGIASLQLLAEVDADADDSAAEMVGPPEADRVAAERHCIEIGPFLTQIDLRRAGTALTPVVDTIQYRETRALIRRGYRVFIAPAGGHDGALDIARDLQARGVRDYYVVTAGAEQNTVSLGLYRDESNARRRHDEIAALGFDVRLEERNEDVPQYWIDVELGEQPDWRRVLGGYSGVDSRDIPCTAPTP